MRDWAWPSARDAIFSINTFAAAMLALYVSFAIGLERPFWAMTTVYITSQPFSGAVRSKAVFRLCGTVVGASAALAMVPVLVNAPVLLSLALSLWVSVCLFVSLLDRTPRGYMFILAGYTAAIVGFPAVTHPETIFDVAMLRAQEIGVGVVCAAFVHAVSFPQSVTGQLTGRIGAIMRDMGQWASDVLAEAPPARVAAERHRIAADISDLHAMATHIPFDTAANRPARRTLLALQERLVLLLPLVSAIEDRLSALRAECPLPPELAEVVASVRAWTASADSPAEVRTLIAQHAAAQDVATWRGMLALNLLDRLTELVAALEETRALVDAVAAGRTPAIDTPVAARGLHLDVGLALHSAVATFVTVAACCALWIVTAWPEGGGAATFAAIICCFFATLDDPVPAQRSFFVGTLISVPLSAPYLFAVLPLAHSFVTLALVLAPVLVGLGLFWAQPRLFASLMPMMIGVVGNINLTNGFAQPDAAAFLNGMVAQLAGALMAIVCTALLRSFGSTAAIERLRAAGRRSLAAVAADPSAARMARWRSVTADRIGLIASRIGSADARSASASEAALRELRLGLTLGRIGAGENVGALRVAVAAHLARPDADGDRLREAIDSAIAHEIDAEPPGRALLADLAGLRRNVCPDASAWAPRSLAA